MRQSSTLIFFGNERLSTGFSPHGAPTLQKIIDAGYHVAAVVAHSGDTTSRNARELEIANVAQANNIPVLLPARPAAIKEQLASYDATAGVLVAYGKIIPQSIIDLFPKGILNLHPSLLPAYRGPTPIEQTILDGAHLTGVSIMQLVKEMDAGPLYAQEKVTLTGAETKHELTRELLKRGGDLLLETLPKVLNSTLAPIEQKGSPTYTSLIKKDQGHINWHQTGQEIERAIRAYAGWPQARGKVALPNDHRIEILALQARIADSETKPAPGTVRVINKQLFVGTATVPIELLRLKVPGRKELSATQFINGYL